MAKVSEFPVLKQAVRRMLYETGCEAEAALAIKRFEGWTLSDDASRNRLMNVLNEHSPRHLSAEWVLIILRLVVYRGGPDLVTGLYHEAIYEGRKAREEGVDRPPFVPLKAGRRRNRGVA